MGMRKDSARLPLITLILTTAILGMILTYLPTAPAANSPASTPQAPPTGTLFDHVVVIMMENEGISDICSGNPPPCSGSNTPYLDSLANTYGIGQQYQSLLKTSQPNYVGILGGSYFTCTSQGECPQPGTFQAPNLVDRLESANLTWKGYFENQTPTTGCDTTNHSPYEYTHNGFVEFQDITNNTARCNKLVLANPTGCTVTDCALINDLNSSSVPNFMWLTPNDCNNMHGASSCSNGCTSSPVSSSCMSTDDSYLSGLIPKILNSKSFKTQRSALFITFDEGTGYCPLINSSSEDCLYSVWAGSLVKTNFFSSRSYNQYSLTSTIETNWNLTPLTPNDTTATPMTDFFKSSGNTNPPPPGTYFDHVVVVMMENQGITDICGGSPPPCSTANTPYMSGLASSFAIGAQYVSLQNNSLPNYVGIIGGSTFGCTDTNCPSITAPNLIDRFEATGVTWKGYMENQTLATGCAATSHLPYVPRHNPFVWYQDITNSSARCNKILLANPNSCGSITDCTLINDLNSSSVPNFMWLTPNICNDMHGDPTCTNGCTDVGIAACILDGDNYLKSLVPTILNSKSFTSQRSALFIVFDEGNRFCPYNGSHEDCLYALWAGPLAKTGFVTNHPFNHYSFTRTIEQNWNLTSLTTNDGSATPMTEFFANPVPTPPTGAYFDHVVVIMMENEGITNICGGNPPPCNGSNSPYLSSLANSYGISQQYLPLIETSEPNYYGILGASIYNCTSSTDPNCYPPAGSITAPNLVDRLEAAGVSWKAYMENQNIAAGCDTGTQEPYQHEHNGFVAFQDITNNTARCNKIVLANPTSCPSGVNGFFSDCTLINDLNSSSVPHFMWLTPNDCNNMHANSVCTVDGCTAAGTSTCIRDGDTYLGSLVPKILSSRAFTSQRSALFIMFDEGVGTACPLNGNSSEDCLFAVWAGPVAKTNYASNHLYNQYSLTRTLEVNWKLSPVTSNDATAVQMGEFFKPDYSISSSTSSTTLLAAGRASSLFTIQGFANFNGTVTLMATSSPAGPSLSITPASITLASGNRANSTLQFNPTVAGNYTVTVFGTSGSLTRNATILFTVQDYALSASPANPKINIATTGSSTISINSANHFTRTITLLATGTTGLNTTITPVTVEGGAGTATLTFSAAAMGNYTAFVSSSSGNLTHTLILTIQVVDFALSATSPPAVNVGAPATSTITVTAINHFDSTVSLADAIPSGLACGSISPATITGSETTTISCSSTTPGNYTVTITGTNGLLSHATTITITVVGFTLTAAPATSTVNAGNTVNSTITINGLNHYNGTTTLSSTISPSTGLACTISPPAITLNATNQTGISIITCTGTGGNYMVTISAAGSGLTQTTSFAVTVRDFTITVSPSASTILAGNTATSTLTSTAISGFTGTITLTDTVTPSGLTCTIAPSTIVLGSSGTSTISCSGPAGIYNVTIAGSSNGINHQALITITVQDFTLLATPASLAVVPGGTGTSTITLTSLDGLSGQVTLSSTISASGFMLTLNPTKPTLSAGGTSTSTLTVTVPNNAVPETYQITVKAVSGSITHTLTVLLSVTSLTISLNPGSLTFPAGTTATFAVVIGSVDGFNNTVTLTVQTQTKLVTTLSSTVVFVPAGRTVSTSLNVTSTAAGSYTLTVTGVSGKLSVKTPNITVVVGTGKDLDLSANPIFIVTQQNTNLSSTITVNSINGLAGTVTLKSSVSPGGPSATLSTQSVILASGGTATFTVAIRVSSSVPVGVYSITLTGTSGPTRTVTISLFVASQSPDFTLVAASETVNVTAGTSGSTLITVSGINGFTGTVNLFSSPSDQGLTCALSQPSIPGSTGNSTLSCNGSPGTYNVTITGTSSILSHSIIVEIDIQDFTISSNPTVTVFPGEVGDSAISVVATGGFTGTITLSAIVTPTTGLSCSLSSVNLTLNDTITSDSTILTCSGSIGNYGVTLNVTSGSLNHFTTIAYSVNDFSISASSPVPIPSSGSATSTITITSLNGFGGTVALSVNPPAGLVCTSPAPSNITGSGTAALSCISNTASTYIVTILGTSGEISHPATATFTVTDFNIAATTPSTVTVGVQSNVTVTVTTVNGFVGTINLTTTGTTGLTCAAISPSLISDSGLATVSCRSQNAGNYTLTIIGSSGSLSHSAAVAFSMTDFTISTISPIRVIVGASTNATITLASVNGFNGVVRLTDSIPIGLSCGAISTSNITGSGTAAVSCTSAIAGNYNLTINGESGILSYSTTAIFTISDFRIGSSSPAPVPVSIPASATTRVFFLNQFPENVSLTDIIPSGLTCGAITPISLGSNGTAAVQCSAGAAGSFVLTVIGTSGTLSHATEVIFTVTDFTIVVSSPISTHVGRSATSTITIAAINGFDGNITLTGTPTSGLVCETISPSSLATSGNATISCTSSTAGNYAVTLTGTSSSVAHNATATFQFQDFAIAANPTTITITNCGLCTSTIQIADLNGFAGLVTLATNSTLCNIAPLNVASSGFATLSCNGLTTSYVVAVTGTNGGLSHVVLVSITIPAGSVGGVTLPIDKIGLILQFLPATAPMIILAMSGIVLKLRKRRRAGD